jgi:hypothetical protein
MTEEAELVGFDGNAAVLEGGVSPDVVDDARRRQELASEPRTLESCLKEVLRDRGDL